MLFGPDYIIPKPLDPRLLSTVAPAVAKAAMETGVAKYPITDWDAYSIELNKRLGLDNQIMRVLNSKARRNPQRIVFAEADNQKILKAASILYDEGVAYPILLGEETMIKKIAAENGIDISDLPVIDPTCASSNGRKAPVCRTVFQKTPAQGHQFVRK